MLTLVYMFGTIYLVKHLLIAKDEKDQSVVQTTQVFQVCVQQQLCVFRQVPEVNQAAESEDTDPQSADSRKLGHLWLRIMC